MWGDSGKLAFTDQEAEATRLIACYSLCHWMRWHPSQGSRANAARCWSCGTSPVPGSRALTAVTASNMHPPWDSHNSGVCAQGPAHTHLAGNRVSPQLSLSSPRLFPSYFITPPRWSPVAPSRSSPPVFLPGHLLGRALRAEGPLPGSWEQNSQGLITSSMQRTFPSCDV